MSKNSQLLNFVCTIKQSSDDKPMSITDMARLAKQELKLNESVEQIRKKLSRELHRIVSVEEVVKEVTVASTPIITERKDTFKEPGTYLVLGCAHVPGHNESMINGITKLIGDIRNLKGLMLIGDFLDLNSLSGHDRGRFTSVRGLTLDGEYEAGNKILNQLTGELARGAEKVYLYGNHEDRWNRYMSDMQNAKTPLRSPKEALRLVEKGFNVFEHWSSDFVKLGNHLELLHGQYYNTHCAKQHIDKLRGSVVFAHTHRVQMYVEGKTAGFNIGWGGDVSHPFFNYAERGTKSQWQNGFALVTIDNEGNYYVQQIFHHNNKFIYNGKSYN